MERAVRLTAAAAVLLAAAFGFTVGQRRREAVMGVVGSGNERTAAPRPTQARLIDSSVAIDARFLDVVKAGFGQGRIVGGGQDDAGPLHRSQRRLACAGHRLQLRAVSAGEDDHDRGRSRGHDIRCPAPLP